MENDKFWIRNYVVDNKIAELRRAVGISQQYFADAIGLSRNAISLIERGAAYPTIRLAFVIAMYFGKTIDEIFTLRRKQ